MKLEAYGLDRYYNAVTPSLAVLEATLAAAQERRQPVFGYFWSPTALIGKYDWQVLEEPPYTQACGQAIAEAVSRGGAVPDEACAYESVAIDALAHSGLQHKASDVVEMLQKMNVGLGPLNETLAWAVENGVADAGDWERAAVHYLQAFEQRWRTWVTQEAYERIKDALDAASTTSSPSPAGTRSG